MGIYLRQSIILFAVLAIVAVSNGQNTLCYTPHLYRGHCISLYECAGLLNFIDARRATGLTWVERQFVVQSQCFTNSGEQPHVCCNNDDPFLQSQASTRRPNVGRTRPSSDDGNLLPDASQNECGRQIFSNKILGGNDTELGEFSWMALLEYENSRGKRDFACGGSLINSRYVLTVAHCLVGRIEQRKGKLINVRLGEHNVDTEQDCEVVEDKSLCADPVQNIIVERTIPHPQYVPNDRNQYHDIGLVRLGQVVTYTDYIQPICLPSAQLRTGTGVKLTVAGWGYTLAGKKSSIKQQLSVPVNDLQQCRNIFSMLPRNPPKIVDTQLCAGGEVGRDSCDGDSGGPLMSLSDGSWYAEGLVSFGISNCGMSGWPGVYTRVTQYLDWIRSNLEP